MKRLALFGLMLVLLTACGESEPPYTDNGNSGQIKVVFFYDDNKNGVMDESEVGVQGQSIAGLSQEVSCPPTSTPTYFDSDANGIHQIDNLKPGKYCLYLNNGYTPVTKLTQEAYVSSDMTTTVYFGLAR
jgi:hypothetical protein